MNKELFDNYEAFYNMVLVCAGLTNSLGDEADDDCKKVIAFIGEAYGLDKDFVADCEDKIINQLSAIGTEGDIAAFYSLCETGTVSKEEEEILNVKADAIRALQACLASHPYGVHEDWFSYNRRKTYFPAVRYAEIACAASAGIVICNKIAGVMAYLGIGTEKRVEGAIQRLRQCAFWGDLASVHLLAKIYAEKGDANAKVYEDLKKLLPYLEEGYTVLPEAETKGIEEKAKQIFAIIASIRHDIILEYNRAAIDYSFVEVMTMEETDYFVKLDCINQYQKGEWKDISNPAKNPKRKIGFMVKEEK